MKFNFHHVPNPCFFFCIRNKETLWHTHEKIAALREALVAREQHKSHKKIRHLPAPARFFFFFSSKEAHRISGKFSNNNGNNNKDNNQIGVVTNKKIGINHFKNLRCDLRADSCLFFSNYFDLFTVYTGNILEWNEYLYRKCVECDEILHVDRSIYVVCSYLNSLSFRKHVFFRLLVARTHLLSPLIIV